MMTSCLWILPRTHQELFNLELLVYSMLNYSLQCAPAVYTSVFKQPMILELHCTKSPHGIKICRNWKKNCYRRFVTIIALPQVCWRSLDTRLIFQHNPAICIIVRFILTFFHEMWKIICYRSWFSWSGTWHLIWTPIWNWWLGNYSANFSSIARICGYQR